MPTVKQTAVATFYNIIHDSRWFSESDAWDTVSEWVWWRWKRGIAPETLVRRFTCNELSCTSNHPPIWPYRWTVAKYMWYACVFLWHTIYRPGEAGFLLGANHGFLCLSLSGWQC